MAALNYAPVCGCGKSLKIFKSGRAAKACGVGCYPRKNSPREPAAKTGACVDCGAPVHKVSSRCIRCVGLENRRKASEAKPTFACRGCGNTFKQKRGRHGEEGTKYCSRQCAHNHIDQWLADPALRTRSTDWSGVGPHCKVLFKNCVTCAVAFVTSYNKAKWCRPCAASSAGDHKSRATTFKVAYEKIDRISVFERAGWCCEICGKATPKEHVGTREGSWSPDAPQLDHIIPISRGGPHLYSNVQCACRACNLSKKNKMKIEQFPLFDQQHAGMGMFFGRRAA